MAEREGTEELDDEVGRRVTEWFNGMLFWEDVSPSITPCI